jgi:hypothetical protein
MATNKYFNFYGSKPEQRLVEDLMVEAIKQFGFDGYYIYNDNNQARDLLYGEDPLKRFRSAFPVELYLSNATGYDGEQEFFSKFGLEIRNSVSVMLSKRTFQQRVPQNVLTRPQEGDLVYIPFTGSSGKGELYEIKFVQGNKDMFMLGRKNPYFYELHLELFKYSQEIIETGVPDIDVISDESSYNVPLNMANVTGNFIYKEIVFQSPDGTYANATCQAICAGWSSVTDIVNITNIAGDFLANTTVHGVSSGAFGTLASYDPIESSQSYVAYDNKVIQNEANNVVNISESNPFGGIGGL